jgi:hypothetical protein
MLIVESISGQAPHTRYADCECNDFSFNYGRRVPYSSVADDSVPELTERINEVLNTQLLNLVVLPGICFAFLDLLQRLIDMINRGHSVSAPLASGLNQLISRYLQ